MKTLASFLLMVMWCWEGQVIAEPSHQKVVGTLIGECPRKALLRYVSLYVYSVTCLNDNNTAQGTPQESRQACTSVTLMNGVAEVNGKTYFPKLGKGLTLEMYPAASPVKLLTLRPGDGKLRVFCVPR